MKLYQRCYSHYSAGLKIALLEKGLYFETQEHAAVKQRATATCVLKAAEIALAQ